MDIKAFGIAAVTALYATAASAATPVADTAKKGSLLFFPAITVESGKNTFIEISNDANQYVVVECLYMNEWKGRNDFTLRLSPKATVSWDVKSRDGDHANPQAFPSTGNYPNFGSKDRGELICFAVDKAQSTQVVHNHLHGNAVIQDGSSTIKYNPWSFQAIDDQGNPRLDSGRPVGQAGKIELTGQPWAYDACPKYNITTFMPNGATLGGITTNSNSLSFASCNQDLRQDYDLHLTKLKFDVWNSNETNFSGAYVCVDSVGTVPLGSANTNLVIGTNFDSSVLSMPNARYAVQGVASTQCRGSENTALLGVVTSSVRTSAGTSVNGTTTHRAGAYPGYVLWDPLDGGVPVLAK